VNWLLSDTLTASGGLGTFTTGLQLNTTFYQFDGTTPISSSNIVATTSGDGLPRYVLTFTTADILAWGGGFKMNQVYLSTNSGTPIGNYLNSLNAGNGLSAGTSGAFYYDPPTLNAVPEPASLMLFGTGVVALSARLRRPRGRPSPPTV
jgi:hypothetical protein